MAEHNHGGQTCDPSEKAAIRQFEIEAMAEAFAVDLTPDVPGHDYLRKERIADVIAAGEYERAATVVFDRMYPPEHPRWAATDTPSREGSDG